MFNVSTMGMFVYKEVMSNDTIISSPSMRMFDCFKLFCGCKVSCYYIVFTYEPCDACVLIRFISHFWSKISKRLVAIRMSWCVFSKKI